MRRLLVIVFAAVLLAAGTASAMPPSDAAAAALPPLGSRCPVGGLVDAVFRDAALHALGRLAVHAPGRAADGAVRLNRAAGHVDADGRAWHQVSAYQTNLGLIGVARVAPQALPLIADWLRWQARHVTPTAGAGGVVLDHWLRESDLAESTCPTRLAARLCGHVDADDSTAASLLLLADAYLGHGGDAALPREPAMRRALEAAAAALALLLQPDGLSWAKPNHPAGYLMDAVEVAAGWRAWSRLQRDAYADAAGADASLAAAARVDAAVQRQLWHAPSGRWRVHSGAAAPDDRRWYPDAMAQAWPLLWSAGQDDAAFERAQGAWRHTALAWQGERHWAARNVDPAGFWWPAAAVAARCAGDDVPARAWVARARRVWLTPRSPFDWPFHVGDLLWLLWLADPPASVAAMDLSRSPSPATQPRTSP